MWALFWEASLFGKIGRRNFCPSEASVWEQVGEKGVFTRVGFLWPSLCWPLCGPHTLNANLRAISLGQSDTAKSTSNTRPPCKSATAWPTHKEPRLEGGQDWARLVWAESDSNEQRVGRLIRRIYRLIYQARSACEHIVVRRSPLAVGLPACPSV